MVQAVGVQEQSMFCQYPMTKTTNSMERVNPSSRSGRCREMVDGKDDKLHNNGGAVECSINVEKVIQMICKEGGHFVDTSNFALAIYDERNGVLDFSVIVDQGERADPCSVQVSNKQGFISLVFDSPDPLLIQDLSKTGFAFETDPICPARPIRSWLSAPIRSPVLSSAGTQGIIIIWSDQPNAFDGQQSQLLCELGTLAGTIVDNSQSLKSEDDRSDKDVAAEQEWAAEVEKRVREELACDLHDGPIQLVSGIVMCLDFCRHILDKDPALLPEQLSCMQEMAERAAHQMRAMLVGLRPTMLGAEGLQAALQAFVECQQKAIKTTKLTLDTETYQPGGKLSRQGAKVEAVVFNIAKEAVNNALKHARASHIEVRLEETPVALRAIIADDGEGFDVDVAMNVYRQSGSMGMINMRERSRLVNGELEINSTPGQGTRITLVVPKVLI